MTRLRLRSIVFSIAVLVLSLSAQTNVAVIPLDAKGVSEIEASVLTERLALELFRTGRFTVLERGKMDEILTEQDFQLSGCVSELVSAIIMPWETISLSGRRWSSTWDLESA